MMEKNKDSQIENNIHEATYHDLFDVSVQLQDEEMLKTYQEISKKRKKMLAQGLEASGVNVEQLEDSYGIVAPITVTSGGAKSYNKDSDSTSFFQSTMEYSADNNKVEMIINQDGSEFLINQNDDNEEEQEEKINQILKSLKNDENDKMKQLDDFGDKNEAKKSILEAFNKIPNINEEELAADEEFDEIDEDEKFYEDEETQEETKKEFSKIEKFPIIKDSRRYRKRNVPIHIININSIQSVLSREVSLMKKDYREIEKPSSKSVTGFYDDMPQIEEDETDFNSESDASRISSKIRAEVYKRSTRTVILTLLTVIMFFISTINEEKFIEGNIQGDIGNYIYLSLALVVISSLFFVKDIVYGIKSLVLLKPNTDSAMALICVSSIAHMIIAIFFSNEIVTGSVHIYPLIAMTVMLLNNVGKFVIIKRVSENFVFLKSKEQKYALRLIGDYNLARDLAGDFVSGTPVIAYQKKANFLKRFMQLSYEADPSEIINRNFTLLYYISAVAIGVIQGIIHGDFFRGVSIFTACICVTTSLGKILCINLPLSRLCRKARKAGAMVSSYYAVAELAKVNSISVNASDIFTSGNIVLADAKLYTNKDTETALLYASVVAYEAGHTYKTIFESIVPQRQVAEIKSRNVKSIDGNGIYGEVKNNTILIGNRDLMIKYSVNLPQKEDVTEYIKKGNKVMFIAFNGDLVAMLVLRYKARKNKIIAVKKLTENGISIIVNSTDSNITQKMLCNMFNLYKSDVKVVTGQVGETFEKVINERLHLADALVATKGKVEAMALVLSECEIQKKLISLVLAMQTIGSILGFFLVVMLSFLGEITQLTSTSILLYQLFWLFAIILTPKIKRR